MDTKQYWAMVAQAIPTIEGKPPYFVTSIDAADTGGGVAGRVCDVSTKQAAAKLIAGRTHRLSTPHEIRQFHEDLKRQTEELAALSQAAKQQFALPEDLKLLVQTAAMIVQREQEKSRRLNGQPNKEIT